MWGPRVVTTVLDLIGLCLLVAGVAWVYPPAGLVVAGAGLLMASWRITRGGDR